MDADGVEDKAAWGLAGWLLSREPLKLWPHPRSAREARAKAAATPRVIADDTVQGLAGLNISRSLGRVAWPFGGWRRALGTLRQNYKSKFPKHDLECC